MGIAEKRKHPRKLKAIKGVAVLKGPPQSEIGCTILDYAEGGARILVAAGCTVPDVFELRIPVYGETRDALVRWRKDLQAGVEFVEVGDSPLKQADLALEIVSLQARLDDLKRLIEQQSSV